MSNIPSNSGNLELLERIEGLEQEVVALESKIKEQGTFSFEEKRIGTWIDGKPLYRKMVAFGALPENSTKSINHGIENIASPHINTGESYFVEKNHGGIYYTTYAFTYANYILRAMVTNTVLDIGSSASGASDYEAFVCVEYTKTTD